MKKYAKVFIDYSGDTPGIVLEVHGAVGARHRDVQVEGRDVEVEIRRNKEAGSAEGFLGFPIIAEVHPREGCDEDSFVEAVATLTSALDAAGYRFVTAADFEDRLPNQGRNLSI